MTNNKGEEREKIRNGAKERNETKEIRLGKGKIHGGMEGNMKKGKEE